MAFQEFTGREYLKIDIASNFGLDKADWNDRLTWFDTNEDKLEELVHLAKTPALFYAGIKAWRDVKAGKPIGYMISLDATSSGLQLLAALTGDLSAAQLCNVVDTGRREDAYTAIYETMVNDIGDRAKVSRDMAKDAVMTALYGSKAVPKRVFGEGGLLNVFFDTMERLAPAAWELNEAFLAMWDPTVLSHDWVLPDNFHVHVKVMKQVYETVHFLNAPYDVTYKVNAPVEEGRSLGANTIHSVDGMVVRELTRRCDYDPKVIHRVWGALSIPYPETRLGLNKREADQMVLTLRDHAARTGYLSARILDYLDDYNIGLVDRDQIRDLILSLPKKPFRVVSIHDCFRCLPHYGNDLRRQYNLQLQLIARSNLLSDLISQITNRSVSVGKLYPDLHQQIGDTNYALS